MKGYRRKLLVKPGTPELAARQKRKEEELKKIREMVAQTQSATAGQAGSVAGALHPDEGKDATQP